jgi:hypothetical protein
MTVRIKGQQIKAIAETTGPEQRKLLWEQLVEVAPMLARYEQSTHREIPMVLLRPVEIGGKR